MKDYIIIYKDEHTNEDWDAYCQACHCSYYCDAIKIYFNHEECEEIGGE